MRYQHDWLLCDGQLEWLAQFYNKVYLWHFFILLMWSHILRNVSLSSIELHLKTIGFQSLNVNTVEAHGERAGMVEITCL